MTGPVAIIGCGGGGGNIVSSLKDSDDVRKITLNAGHSATILLGGAECKGDQSMAWALTSENIPRIGEAIADCSAIIAVASLGGGVGSGAISVVIECARDIGARVVSVVCIPMSFEADRRARALNQLSNVIKISDRTIVIDMDHLGNVVKGDIPFRDVMTSVDALISEAISRIAQMTQGPFYSIFTARTYTTAYSQSVDPGKAAEQAINSRLFDTDPTEGKIVAIVDSGFSRDDEEIVRTVLSNMTGIVPEVTRERGKGKGTFLFIPMVFHA